MIVVDTSALMAVLLNEPAAEHCAEVLANERVLVSAVTMAEALVVADRRGLRKEMADLLDGLDLEVVDASAATARQVADVYARWGKGIHRASLNFGDCFAYGLAQNLGCGLLFVGDDFARTDVRAVG